VLALLAFAATAIAVLGIGGALQGQFAERSVVTIIAVAIGLEVLVGVLAPAVLDLTFVGLFAVTGGLGLLSVYAAPKVRHLALVVLVAVHFALMAWMFAAVPLPDMDVHLFQQDAAAALLNGENPYGITFENIYGYGTRLYAPEVQLGDRVTFGFPYPPLSLLLAIPGHLLVEDVRYAALAATSITALLVGFAHPGPLATGASVILLLSPLTARVLHNGWTEPFVVVWLAATTFLAIRAARGTPLALGLLIATKQYVPVLLPLGIVLLRDVRNRVGVATMTITAIGAALITMLPFLIWDLGRFIFSTIEFQAVQPFRDDGSTVAALLFRAGWWVPPTWLGFILAGAMVVVVLIRAQRTPASFALGSASVLLIFFLFSKVAFMNYYFVAMVALLCAVAATERPRAS
jgi:hypothetical protein